jgi:hypothetical protein
MRIRVRKSDKVLLDVEVESLVELLLLRKDLKKRYDLTVQLDNGQKQTKTIMEILD